MLAPESTMTATNVDKPAWTTADPWFVSAVPTRSALLNDVLCSLKAFEMWAGYLKLKREYSHVIINMVRRQSGTDEVPRPALQGR